MNALYFRAYSMPSVPQERDINSRTRVHSLLFFKFSTICQFFSNGTHHYGPCFKIISIPLPYISESLEGMDPCLMLNSFIGVFPSSVPCCLILRRLSLNMLAEWTPQ